MIVFDIDGVLANNDHRLHYIQRTDGQAADWEGFYAASGQDGVIVAGVMLLATLQSQHDVCLLTGRPENWRRLTVDWLGEHTDFFVNLQHCSGMVMREVSDFRPDYEYKLDAIKRMGRSVALVVDDSIRVIEHLVDNGYTCLHFRRPGEQKGWAVQAKHEARTQEQTT